MERVIKFRWQQVVNPEAKVRVDHMSPLTLSAVDHINTKASETCLSGSMYCTVGNTQYVGAWSMTLG
jgi:hypothetical protein